MNKLLIIGNWKCNPTTLQEAKRLFDSIQKGIKNLKNVEIVICPPFVYLSNLLGAATFARPRASLAETSVAFNVGGQDCFWEKSGPFTGEISAKMLKDLGCQYVILGHSERRKLGETDEMINKKVKAALKANLKQILCVGDKNRKSKEDIKEIEVQLRIALAGIKSRDIKNLIISYEPIWAISTTKNSMVATPKDAIEGALFIKKILAKLFGKTLSQGIKILYGGSVDSQNARSFVSVANMAGVLVGQASLDTNEFIRIVKNISQGSF